MTAFVQWMTFGPALGQGVIVSWCHEALKKCCILSEKGSILRKLLWDYITEAMLGKAVSIYSACRESVTFIYEMLPENNELWPSALWWLQIFMLRKETSPSSCHALQCPPETEVWTLFFGFLSGSYGNCPDVLNSALEQHPWDLCCICSHLFPTERTGMGVPPK